MKIPKSLAAIALSAPLACAEPQPNFSLPDVNPNSVRTGEVVSLTDYQGYVCVVYFGREW